ncbi:hypothetical protein V5799_030357 [Amblyomma americanum]|uniref:Uncharacterized protein n=1 Tax=Amblyomma americanum TaxID=6943 RepID=A0AAQ4ENJ3_AMBAM
MRRVERPTKSSVPSCFSGSPGLPARHHRPLTQEQTIAVNLHQVVSASPFARSQYCRHRQANLKDIALQLIGICGCVNSAPALFAFEACQRNSLIHGLQPSGSGGLPLQRTGETPGARSSYLPDAQIHTERLRQQRWRQQYG